jgi:rod shape determining protein RodA
MEDTYEKQLIFCMITIPLIFIVLSVDGKFYEKYATIIFGISPNTGRTILIWKTIAGQRCWYAIGSFTIQPSEFAKANIISVSDTQINLKEKNRQIQALAILLLPVLLIPQPDPGVL